MSDYKEQKHIDNISIGIHKSYLPNVEGNMYPKVARRGRIRVFTEEDIEKILKIYKQ